MSIPKSNITITNSSGFILQDGDNNIAHQNNYINSLSNSQKEELKYENIVEKLKPYLDKIEEEVKNSTNLTSVEKEEMEDYKSELRTLIKEGRTKAKEFQTDKKLDENTKEELKNKSNWLKKLGNWSKQGADFTGNLKKLAAVGAAIYPTIESWMKIAMEHLPK